MGNVIGLLQVTAWVSICVLAYVLTYVTIMSVTLVREDWAKETWRGRLFYIAMTLATGEAAMVTWYAGWRLEMAL